MSITTFDNDFSIIRNANVDVELVKIKNKSCAKIIVNDSYEHIFKPTSAMTDSAITNGLDQTRQALQGGTFFFHTHNDLVNYKTKNYNGFIHNDEGIAALIEHIGHTTDFPRAQYTNSISSKLRLQNVHSNVELDFGNLNVGSQMNSELSFAWDPFQAHVRAVFRLIRLVCSNGMVGLHAFMNCKIPIMNEWVEHMRIANAQIQNKVTSLLGQRAEVMTLQRSSIRDCQLIVDACHQRIKAPNITKDMIDRIKHIAYVCDPELHCKKHYSSTVFQDRRLSAQTASHLTQFTVWNMATELATHTLETEQSTNFALQKLANVLLIDGDKKVNAHRNDTKVSVKFDDLDAAFAGNLVTA